jgi:hypothetical protein
LGNWVALDCWGKGGTERLDKDERLELARRRWENAGLAMACDVLIGLVGDGPGQVADVW